MKEDPTVSRIATDARLYHELQDQPGWRRLREKVKHEHESYVQHLGERLFHGVDVDPQFQREVDFHRGWYMALEWFTGTPEKALESFEAAAKKAYTLALLELQVADEDNTPYT